MIIRPLIALLAFPIAALAAPTAEPSSTFRDLTFPAALAAAASENKIVLVDFYATWCGPCKMLDQTTWKDPGVGELLRSKTIALRLDAEKETDLAARYKIEAYPTILLLKPDGTVIDRLVGYRDAATFTQEFTSTLAGKTSLTRAEDQVAQAGDSHAQLQARFQLAQALARQGRSADALKQYLWLFDWGMKQDPSFRGVRVSFLLNAIAQLAQSYPQAGEELENRRDAAEKRMESDPDDRDSAQDFAGINRALHDDTRTLAAYDRLAPDDRRRRILARNIFDLLLQAHRYKDAAQAQPVAQFLKLFGMETAEASQLSSNPQMLAMIKAMFAKQALDEIEVLAGAGQPDDARLVADKLRAFDSSKETAIAIADRTKTAPPAAAGT